MFDLEGAGDRARRLISGPGVFVLSSGVCVPIGSECFAQGSIVILLHRDCRTYLLETAFSGGSRV